MTELLGTIQYTNIISEIIIWLSSLWTKFIDKSYFQGDNITFNVTKYSNMNHHDLKWLE